MNKILAAALVSAFVGTGSFAMAQTAGRTAAPATTAAPAAAAAKGAHRNFDPAARAQRVEQRLERVKSGLKITAAQQPQWDAYASFVRKTAQDGQQRRQQMQQGRNANTPRANAIERLERQQARQAESASRLTQLIAVEKPLYASLSAEQKQTADKLLNRFGGRGGRGGHHRMAGNFERHDRGGEGHGHGKPA